MEKTKKVWPRWKKCWKPNLLVLYDLSARSRKALPTAPLLSPHYASWILYSLRSYLALAGLESLSDFKTIIRSIQAFCTARCMKKKTRSNLTNQLFSGGFQRDQYCTSILQWIPWKVWLGKHSYLQCGAVRSDSGAKFALHFKPFFNRAEFTRKQKPCNWYTAQVVGTAAWKRKSPPPTLCKKLPSC